MTDLLNCGVCLDRYAEPQLLTACGHSFCKFCVESLPSRRRVCPICRTAIPARDGYRPNFALQQALQDMAASPATHAASVPAGSTAASAAAPLVRTSSTGEDQRAADVKSRKLIKQLVDLGLPWGLARQVQQEDGQIALRIFLLDNSGSTAATDGNKLIQRKGEMPRMERCTRWEETKFMAMEQAKWNARIGTPCEFMLLNPAGMTIRVTPESEEPMDTQLANLESWLNRARPSGPTPLSERLRDICNRISARRDELVRAGQSVMLIIATDGEPSSSPEAKRQRLSAKDELVQMLRKILGGGLPVRAVIRLTTDDDNVVDFYNRIDEELEFPLDVLDDIVSEAKEIAAKGNGWLTYSPLIHMIREQGTLVQLFDDLDERCLGAQDAMIFARLMLQEDAVGMLPGDPEDFCRCAAEQLRNAPLVYNPITRKMAPCVNVNALHARLIPLCERVCPACCKRRGQRGRPRRSLFESLRDFTTYLTTPSYDVGKQH